MTAGSFIMMIIGLLGGLGVFMFGMKSLSEGLEKTAGSKLKGLLQAVTRNRFLAVLCGAVMTILIQSSTATTVMVVGFVNANLLTLTQAIGVIMGANIGTTATPLLLALEGLDLGMIFAFIGLILSWLPNNKRCHTLREFSPIVMGIGLLFVGIKAMSNAMVPLREWEGFKIAIQSISNPILGVLIGMIICILLHSSAASVGMLQALASQGLIPLSTAMFVLFGQNIGTCLTSLIASQGTSATARRASLVHLLFNTMGTVIFVAFACIFPFADWIEALAPGQLMLQIALIHIIFNLVTTLILLPCANLLEKLSILIIHDKKSDSSEMRLRYFDPRLMKSPTVVVTQLEREVERMGDLARANFTDAFACFDQWDAEAAEKIMSTENVLDFLNHEIARLLTDVKGLDLSDADAHLVGSLFHVINDLERVGDHAENILDAARTKEEEEVKFTGKVMNELNDMRDRVLAQLDIALELFHDPRKTAENLTAVEAAEAEIDNLTEALRTHHVDRLKNKKCSPKNGMLYLDILTNLERIGDHAENIATSRTKS